MSFRSIRWIAASLLLALPVAAHAQTARVEGMAIQNDYIKDYSNIFTWLSQVPNVGNIVYGDLGVGVPVPGGVASTDRAVGAVLGNLWDGRYGTWAIHLHEITPQLGEGDQVSNFNPGDLGSDPNFNTNSALDLMWGRKFGTTSLGLRFSHSHSRAEGPGVDMEFGMFDLSPGGIVASLAGDPNLERNSTGFGAGLGFDMNPNANLELAALYESRTFKVDSAGTTYEDNGPGAYQLAARIHWQWQPNVMLVPMFKWYSFDLSSKRTGTVAYDNSLKGWQLGLAGNWTLGTNDLFVLGADVAGNRVEQDNVGLLGIDVNGDGVADYTASKISETSTPDIFAALETHVNSWLTLRFGASKAAWHNVKLEDPGTTVKLNDAPFLMRLGAGVKVGTLMVDGVLSNDFPHNLPFFVSGATTANMFPKVTATYTF
ncbi:MAG TPA: hypothetical protein VFK69_04115 [Candidatus Eisenbacteria bacterium]|nr:hypothetical protein [Candidatus Eisenbacteria bacterium]